MRIALDARWVFREASGIGNYTRELAGELARIPCPHRYVVYFDDAHVMASMSAAGLGNAPHVECRLLSFGVFSPRNQVWLPRELRRDAADLYHAPNYMIPLGAFPRHRRGGIACVATIHDVIPLLFPRAAPRARKARLFPLYRWIMRQVAARADAIITDSEASRADLVEQLRIGPRHHGKVKRVYCGVRMPANSGARPAGGGVPDRERMLLYVGRSDPYKNLCGTVRAFAEARRQAPFPLRLVVAGSRDSRYPEAPALARRMGLEAVVEWRGYVSDSELAALYRAADVLVHLSLYEGFGLQVADAMAAGLPVVCSRAGALPEVVGKAAVTVDPDDVLSAAQAIVRVLSDSALASRLSSEGRERAAAFTWRRAALETLAVYESLNAPDGQTAKGPSAPPAD